MGVSYCGLGATPKSSAPAYCCRRCDTRCCPPRGRWCAVRTIAKGHSTRLGYISPEPARLNGNTFPVGSLPSAAARRCADHASSAARFSSAQSCLRLHRPTSAPMIQHRLGEFETHAEALQPCRERPAQVLQPPAAPGSPGPPNPRLRNQILVMPPPGNAAIFSFRLQCGSEGAERGQGLPWPVRQGGRPKSDWPLGVMHSTCLAPTNKSLA